jgi:hypothetical protein
VAAYIVHASAARPPCIPRTHAPRMLRAPFCAADSTQPHLQRAMARSIFPSPFRFRFLPVQHCFFYPQSFLPTVRRRACAVVLPGMAEFAEAVHQAFSEVAAELGEAIRAALVRPHIPEQHGQQVMSDGTKEMLRQAVRDKAVEVCAAITRALSSPKRTTSDGHTATASPPAPKRVRPNEPPPPQPTAPITPLLRGVNMPTAPIAAAQTNLRTAAASNKGSANQKAAKTTIRVTKFHSVVSAGGMLTYVATLNGGSEKKLHYTDFCRVDGPLSLIALLEAFMDSEFFHGSNNEDMRPKVMKHIKLLKDSSGTASDHGTLAAAAPASESESDSEAGTVAAGSDSEADSEEPEQCTVLDSMHRASPPHTGTDTPQAVVVQVRERAQAQDGRVPEQAAAADAAQKIDVTAVLHATMLEGEVMYTVLADGGEEVMVTLSDIKDRATDLGKLHECMVQYCQENEADDDVHLKHTVVEHTIEVGRLLPPDSGALF